MGQADSVTGTTILRDAVRVPVSSGSSIPGFSIPPSGMCKVVNFYINPVTGKLVVEYDNMPVP